MKGLFRAAGVAAIALASVSTGVTAAHAAPACGTGKVCLWDNYWFTWTERPFSWVTYNVGSAANDQASSLVVGPASNPASPYVYFYADAGYAGPYKLIYREFGAHNDLRGQMMTTNRNWDDEISSVWG
jgi:hypothetical protein